MLPVYLNLWLSSLPQWFVHATQSLACGIYALASLGFSAHALAHASFGLFKSHTLLDIDGFTTV
jgi:hypothetical protein